MKAPKTIDRKPRTGNVSLTKTERAELSRQLKTRALNGSDNAALALAMIDLSSTCKKLIAQ